MLHAAVLAHATLDATLPFVPQSEGTVEVIQDQLKTFFKTMIRFTNDGLILETVL